MFVFELSKWFLILVDKLVKCIMNQVNYISLTENKFFVIKLSKDKHHLL